MPVACTIRSLVSRASRRLGKGLSATSPCPGARRGGREEGRGHARRACTSRPATTSGALRVRHAARRAGVRLPARGVGGEAQGPAAPAPSASVTPLPILARPRAGGSAGPDHLLAKASRPRRRDRPGARAFWLGEWACSRCSRDGNLPRISQYRLDLRPAKQNAVAAATKPPRRGRGAARRVGPRRRRGRRCWCAVPAVRRQRRIARGALALLGWVSAACSGRGGDRLARRRLARYRAEASLFAAFFRGAREISRARGLVLQAAGRCSVEARAAHRPAGHRQSHLAPHLAASSTRTPQAEPLLAPAHLVTVQTISSAHRLQTFMPTAPEHVPDEECSRRHASWIKSSTGATTSARRAQTSDERSSSRHARHPRAGRALMTSNRYIATSSMARARRAGLRRSLPSSASCRVLA